MIGVLLSLIPLIGWGAGDFIAARGARKINPFSLSYFFMIVGFLVTVPVGLLVSTPDFSLINFLVFLCSSIFFNAGFLIMLRGFHYGPVGIVAPIANSYALVTTLYAVIFQNADVSSIVLLGIATVIAGIGLVSYSKPKPGEFKNVPKTIVFAIISHISFGIGFIFLDRASTQAWNQNTVLVQCSGFIVATLIWLLLQKKDRIVNLVNASKKPIYYVGGAAGGIGLLGMNAAFQQVDTIAIPTAIAAAAPLVTALLAYIFDKEHLTFLQRVATVTIVAGIVLLSVG